jgi:hypothetical protein
VFESFDRLLEADYNTMYLLRADDDVIVEMYAVWC